MRFEKSPPTNWVRRILRRNVRIEMCSILRCSKHDSVKYNTARRTLHAVTRQSGSDAVWQACYLAWALSCVNVSWSSTWEAHRYICEWAFFSEKPHRRVYLLALRDFALRPRLRLHRKYVDWSDKRRGLYVVERRAERMEAVCEMTSRS